jgi:DNA-binding response OmpR family regulator
MGEAVLLVEQEEPTREFLSRQLVDDGFEVLAADRAADALELVESQRPDLVLLDAILPDASGSRSVAASEPASRAGRGTATSR